MTSTSLWTNVTPVQYNYCDKEELEREAGGAASHDRRKPWSESVLPLRVTSFTY